MVYNFKVYRMVAQLNFGAILSEEAMEVVKEFNSTSWMETLRKKSEFGDI